MLSLLEPLTPFPHHPRNKGLAFEHLATGPWLLEQIGLHPREQTVPLRAGLLLPQTFSTLTSNFLKLKLPVGHGRSQPLPQSSRDGRRGQGALARSQAGLGEQEHAGGAGQEGVHPDSSLVFQHLRYFAFFQNSG